MIHNAEDIFDIEHSETILSKAKEKLLSTPLGHQFNQLQKVHKKIAKCDYQSDNLNVVEKNLFLKENGEVSTEPYSELYACKAEESGINSLLHKEALAIRYLIEGLGLLQDFTAFICAFNQGYSLAGHSGNIMMYIVLCRQTTQLIQCYGEIHQRLMQKFSEIQTVADIIRHNLMQQQEYNDPWIRNYARAKRYLRQAQENLAGCYQTLQKMIIQMENVYSFEYLEKVQKEMRWFEKTITIISSRYGKNRGFVVVEPELENSSEKLALTLSTTSMVTTTLTSSVNSSTSSSSTLSPERKQQLLKMTENLKNGIGFYSITPSNTISETPQSSGTPPTDAIIITNSSIISKTNG